MTLYQRGFTLIELLVAMVITATMGTVIVKMVQTSQRVSRAQMQQVDMQSNVRTATLALPNELKEIGYDSNTTNPVPAAAISTDLVTLGANTITFDAARGFGLLCGVPTLTEMRIARPFYGIRDPLVADRFLLFVENDENTGIDDLWIPLTVTAVDPASNCGAVPAIRLTFPTPSAYPGGPNLALSQLKVNSPIRVYERMQYGLLAAGGRSWLGARSISQGELNLTPVLGPLANGTGVGFRYFDSANNEVLPGGNVQLVRRIQVTINGETTGRTNLAGASQTQVGVYQLVTDVALRNSLRP